MSICELAPIYQGFLCDISLNHVIEKKERR